MKERAGESKLADMRTAWYEVAGLPGVLLEARSDPHSLRCARCENRATGGSSCH